MTPALKQKKMYEHLNTIDRLKASLRTEFNTPDEEPERQALQQLLRIARAELTALTVEPTDEEVPE